MSAIWARVVNGVVINRYYAPSPAPGDVRGEGCMEGWSLINGEFLPPLADFKAAVIDQITNDAGLRINVVYPLHNGKQNNMSKRTLQILRQRIMGTPLSAATINEENALISAGDWVDSVRTAARNAIGQVRAATTHAAVRLVIPAWPVITPPEWPA